MLLILLGILYIFDFIVIFVMHCRIKPGLFSGQLAKRDLHKLLFPKLQICDRTSFDNKTVNKVFAGDPWVAIGTYLQLLERNR